MAITNESTLAIKAKIDQLQSEKAEIVKTIQGLDERKAELVTKRESLTLRIKDLKDDVTA